MFVTMTDRLIRELEMTDAEKQAAERIIAECKEDETKIEEYCRMAMHSVNNERWEIFRPKAEICKNKRVNDRFFEGSGILDVWIEFLAFDEFNGAYEVGVCLSDIWDTPWETIETMQENMYLNIFNNHLKKSYLTISDGRGECCSCGYGFDEEYTHFLKKAKFCPECGCEWKRQEEYIREREKTL